MVYHDVPDQVNSFIYFIHFNSLMPFIDAFHWCSSSVQFIVAVHFCISLMQFIDAVHWCSSFMQVIDVVHWCSSLMQFIDAVHWCSSFRLFLSRSFSSYPLYLSCRRIPFFPFIPFVPYIPFISFILVHWISVCSCFGKICIFPEYDPRSTGIIQLLTTFLHCPLICNTHESVILSL